VVVFPWSGIATTASEPEGFFGEVDACSSQVAIKRPEIGKRAASLMSASVHSLGMFCSDMVLEMVRVFEPSATNVAGPERGTRAVPKLSWN